MTDPTVGWLADPTVPLGWFLLALLTRPAAWSNAAASIVKRRLDAE